jgi:Mrp family chromosome partitioning ATPase/LPS O-antigen subunit length determinant protein (WzzB/FepE family)
VKTGVEHGASSLRDYLHIVRRQKWIILQALVLVPLVALLYSWHETPVYQGSATVLLSRQDLADQLTNAQNQTALSQTLVPTQAAVARVTEIASRTIAQLNLPAMTPQQFLQNSSVTQSANADTLGFDFRSTDPALAQNGATKYAQNYVAYKHSLDTASFESARREVDGRIQQLEAQGDAKGALYTSLVEREQQLQTLEALQTSNATVVQTARSAVKVTPKTARNGVLGLVLGLFLGLGLAFLRETLDTRVRSAQEIGDRLGLPLLGRVPEPPKHLRSMDRLSMLEEPSGLHAEAFRVLRTNIEFSVLDSSVRTVMITSAVEQEGKSTTIANLAVALARGGQSVALVDLDLRRPYVDRFFDVGERPGITQVALGRATLEEALVPIPIASIKPSAALRPRYEMSSNGHSNGNGNGVGGRLYVVGSGPIPPDPGEFVASHALTSILLQLQEVAEVILIDAPPLLRVGDAMVLSAKVDALLLATRMEKVRRPMLTDIHRMLDTSPARVLGFVVTGAEAEEGYGYGFGYGYGYGHYLEPAAAEPVPEPSETR